MARLTPKVSKILARRSNSPIESGQLIGRLVASLDEGSSDEGVEEAWAEDSGG